MFPPSYPSGLRELYEQIATAPETLPAMRDLAMRGPAPEFPQDLEPPVLRGPGPRIDELIELLGLQSQPLPAPPPRLAPPVALPGPADSVAGQRTPVPASSLLPSRRDPSGGGFLDRLLDAAPLIAAGVTAVKNPRGLNPLMAGLEAGRRAAQAEWEQSLRAEEREELRRTRRATAQAQQEDRAYRRRNDVEQYIGTVRTLLSNATSPEEYEEIVAEAEAEASARFELPPGAIRARVRLTPSREARMKQRAALQKLTELNASEVGKTIKGTPQFYDGVSVTMADGRTLTPRQLIEEAYGITFRGTPGSSSSATFARYWPRSKGTPFEDMPIPTFADGRPDLNAASNIAKENGFIPERESAADRQRVVAEQRTLLREQLEYLMRRASDGPVTHDLNLLRRSFHQVHLNFDVEMDKAVRKVAAELRSDARGVQLLETVPRDEFTGEPLETPEAAVQRRIDAGRAEQARLRAHFFGRPYAPAAPVGGPGAAPIGGRGAAPGGGRGAGPGTPAPAAPTAKAVTVAELQVIAKRRGTTIEQEKARAVAAGYVVR